MKTPYYTPERKREEKKNIRAYISAYNYVIDTLNLLLEIMEKYNKEGKRIYKKEIDFCNQALPDTLSLELVVEKYSWLPNKFRLHFNDSPHIQNFKGEKILADAINIHPFDYSPYIEKDRTFHFEEFKRATLSLIKFYKESIERKRQAHIEFDKWSAKMNKLVELYKEIKTTAPEYFKYSIPDMRYETFYD